MKSSEALPTNVVPLRMPDSAARRAQREFLPAALEIVETPASPLGRAIAVTLIVFFVIAIVWSIIGHVDIVATAQGKIVPTGRTKMVQPLEAGIVSAIPVQDGDRVKAGQIVIRLDQTVALAERGRIMSDLLAAQLDVARLSALRIDLEAGDGLSLFSPPDRASQAQISRTRAAMVAQASAQRGKVASIDEQIAQKIAEADVVAGTISKLEKSLPLVSEQAAIRRKAVAIEFGNRIAHLDAEIRFADQTNELVVQKRHAPEVLAARLALESQRQQAVSEYAQKVLSDLADAEQKVAGLTEDLAKANQKLDQTLLRAPVDGTVQQLAIHSVGGVVTPAQQLMMIVPLDSRLEAEAMISNRDIGFVRPGQEAEIKVDTFNFTRYGLLRGSVTGVSQDSIMRERPMDKFASNQPRAALTESSEPQGQELIYAARVSLDRTNIDVEGRSVDLAPGMAVTVEIKTGSRRLIEFLMSPLLRYKQQSLRER